MKSIRIFSPALIFLGEIDNYTSFTLTMRYFYPGDFELQIPLNCVNAYHLQKGNFIMLGKDYNKNGVITYKTVSVNDEGTEMLNIIGVTLDGLLKQRITEPPSGAAYDIIDSDAESVIKHYINNNVVNPSNGDRKIDVVNLTVSQNRGSNIKWQSRYKKLREELSKIQLATNTGIKASINYDTKRIDIDTYDGQDKTTGNRVIFSLEFDNIQSQEYIQDMTNYKDFAYVAGQGQGDARTIVSVGDSSGIDRFETFVDARDITDSSDLIVRGYQKLLETPIIETFTSSVLPNNTFIYEKDWNLGDIVIVQNKKWGITANSRITEVTETYEEDGFNMEVTFGNKIPTLIDLVKAEISNIEQEVTI